MEITSKILKTELVRWKDMKFLQSKKFKNLTAEREQKLRESILANSFIECFNVWENDGDLYCLDGYHRSKVLKDLEKEGHQIHEMLPANFIICADKKEAAKLVLIYSSLYARTEQQGFLEFLKQHDLDVKDVELVIDIPDFSFLTEEAPEETIEVEPNIKAELPPAIVQKGDLFRLGEHWLLCGDSTDSAQVLQLMGEIKAVGSFTSPPYAEQRKSQYDSVPEEEYGTWFERVQDNICAVLRNDGSFFLNIKAHCDNGERSLYVNDLVSAMKRKHGWLFVEEYCWLHQGYPGALAGRFKNQFEPVYHFTRIKPNEIVFRPDNVLKPLSHSHYEKLESRKNGKAKEAVKGHKHASGMGDFSGYGELQGARPGNVIEFNTGAGSDHPASFPVGLPEHFIKAFSDKNDIWYEPFGGSGTTLIACERTGRQARVMEIKPEFCELTIRRWADYRRKTDSSIDFECTNRQLTLEEIEANNQ